MSFDTSLNSPGGSAIIEEYKYMPELRGTTRICVVPQLFGPDQDKAFNGVGSLPLVNFGIATGKEARSRVRYLLDQVRLPLDLATLRPAELSGGQRQRVAIA